MPELTHDLRRALRYSRGLCCVSPPLAHSPGITARAFLISVCGLLIVCASQALSVHFSDDGSAEGRGLTFTHR